MLYRAVDESIFEKIVGGASTSKEEWDILEKVFKGVYRELNRHVFKLYKVS